MVMRYFHHIDLKSLYFKAVFSIVNVTFNDYSKLESLKDDIKFINTLEELKERFDDEFEILTK